MTDTPGNEAAPAFVKAPLIFLVDTGEKPVIIPSEGGGHRERRIGESDEREVVIENARLQTEAFSLDRQGFLLVHHETQVDDFYHEENLAAIYEAEVDQLVKEVTGASRVVVFDHTLRADSRTIREDRLIREPSETVHNDYTERSAPQRVRDLLPPEEAERLLGRRFAIVNVWRSINGAVETAPLVMCDARTLAPSDLIATERRARNRIGETYRVTFNPKQRWFYFPKMQMNEALLIKCWDSAEDGRARFSAHTSFKDPKTPAGAAPRESIESRTFVFF